MKILWVSDWHFSQPYLDKRNNFISIWDSFIESIKLELNNGSFTHILLSGDLAYSGVYEEYIYLSKYFRELREIVGNVPIILIPGNHDINWGNIIDSFRKYIIKQGKSIKDSDISLFFQDELFAFEIWKKEDKLRMEHYVNFRSNLRMEGFNIISEYYYCEDFNICFLPIDSTYNSFGSANVTAFSEFRRLLESMDAHDTDRLFIQYLNAFNEYGSQVYILDNIFEQLRNEETVLQRNNPIIISIAHHGLDWISYNQKYSSTKSKSQINKLFEFSQIHLSGHDHTDPRTSYSYINNTLLLKSGKFCDQLEVKSNLDQQSVFENNWFSVIELERTRCELVFKNFKLEVDASTRSFSWSTMDPIKLVIPYKSYFRPINLQNKVKIDNFSYLLKEYSCRVNDLEDFKRSLFFLLDEYWVEEGFKLLGNREVVLELKFLNADELLSIQNEVIKSQLRYKINEQKLAFLKSKMLTPFENDYIFKVRLSDGRYCDSLLNFWN